MAITPTVRFQVLNRDNFECKYCGLKAGNGIQLQVDHIIPKSKGGTDDINNLITCCFQCNIGKRDKLISDKTELYKLKIKEKIKYEIKLFYDFWNKQKLGQIDSNTKALISIYYSYSFGGTEYQNYIDNPIVVKRFLGKDIKEMLSEDGEKLYNLFLEGGDVCDTVLSLMEGGIIYYDIDGNLGFNEGFTDLFDNRIRNNNLDYNDRLNYELGKNLYISYINSNLENDFSIKKFCYYYNEIKDNNL